MDDTDDAWGDLFGAGRTGPRDPDATAALARVRGELFGGPREPERLGRLVVLERLGRGGMGTVFAAYDPDLDRKVAVKVLHARHERASARALREGRALARISHPNVVVVHDVEMIDDRVHIVMEYVGGGTLRAWLREPRSWRDILARFVEAGRGLAAVHTGGLVHGDFKPDNVLMGTDGTRARVADFGLAVLGVEALGSIDGEASATTPGGGTAGYAPPEQARGEAIDARADQFAFCVALYEALFGVRPFSPAAIASGVLGEPASARPDAPASPPAIAGILERGLAADRERRHDAMGALLDRLDALAGPRRRAWVVPLAAIGGIGLGLVVAMRATARDCDANADDARARWQDGRASVTAALLAAGSSTDATERVEGKLDAWVGTWAEVRRDACEAGTPARMECLDDAHRRFLALTSAIGTVQNDEIDHVVTAVGDLDDPTRCSADVRRPAPVADAVDVARLRARLAEAEAEDLLGRYDDALRIAHEVVLESEQLGDDALVAEALHQRGNAEENLSRAPDARATQEAAVWHAYRAGDHRVAALSAARLAYLRGSVDANTDEGRWWLRLAEEAVAIAEPQGPIAAVVHRSAAAIAIRSGDLADARAHLEAGIAIYRETFGDRHYGTGSALQNLAAVTAMSGDVEHALVLLDEAIAIQEEALGPEHPFTASIFKSKGEVLRRLRRHDEAIAVLRDGIARLERAVAPEHELLGDTLGVLGQTLRDAGDLRGATEVTRKALAIKQHAWPDGNVELAIEHNNLALLLQDGGDLEGAEHELRESLAIKERLLGAQDFQLAPSLVNLAQLLEDLDREEEAAPLVDRALAILAAIAPIEPVDTLGMRTRCAGFIRRRGQPDRARDVLQHALSEADRAGVAMPHRIAAHRELASAGLALGDPASASAALATMLPFLDDPIVSVRQREKFAVVQAEVDKARAAR